MITNRLRSRTAAATAIVALVLTLVVCAAAQGVPGQWVLANDATVSLVFEGAAGGSVQGILEGQGLTVRFEGQVDDADPSVAYGWAYGEDGAQLGFEAYVEGAELYLVVVGFTAAGELDYDNATELVFARSGSGAPSLIAPPAPGAAGPPASGSPAGNALGESSGLAGRFEGDGLVVSIEASGNGYRGTLEIGGTAYPFTATGQDGVLSGSFQSGADAFAFEAALQGDVLTVTSGGATYRTVRIGGAPVGGGLPGGAPAASSRVVAQGAHGSLTEDDALAFIDALEFSLQQVGYAYRFSAAERQQLFDTIVQSYPAAEPHEQAVLSQARFIWNRVQANWHMATEQEKREFLVGVFVLAFGEEYVQQQIGGARGGGGGGGACTDFDACMSSFVDGETYSDTMNAQGCWAAAGCSGYDAGSNDFTYDDPGY